MVASTSVPDAREVVQAELEPRAAVEVGSRRIAVVFERETPRATEEEARGTVIVHIDAPAGVCAMVEVAFVDEFPTGFLPGGDSRVLRESLDYACWGWNPLASPEDLDPEDPRPRIVGDRVLVEFPASDLPLGRRLWACLSTVHFDNYDIQLGYTPRVVEIPPIESVDDPARIEFTLQPFGGITGRVLGSELRDDELVEPTREELALFVYDVGARLRGATSAPDDLHDGRFQLWPLASGRYEFDVLVTTWDSLHRRVDSAVVRDGESTDTGTWELQATHPVSILQSSDEDGAPLDGRFVLDLDGYPAASIETDGWGRAYLHGAWSECRRIRFEPWEARLFEQASVEVSGILDPLVTLVSRRRGTALSRIVLKPMWHNVPMWSQRAWAYVRRDADQSLRAVDLGYSGGCSVHESDLLEPGRHEVIAWLPERGLVFRGPLDVPDWREDFQLLGVEFEDPGTLVRGTLRMTSAGVEASDRLDVWLRPQGTEDVVPSHLHRVFFNSSIGFPGSFELRGVPPDMDLELSFRDDTGRVLVRRKLRVAPGETLELGVVEAVLR